MAATYEFTVDITVDGKPYKKGDTVAESDVAPGTFSNLKRLKQVVLLKDTPPDLQAAPTAADEPPKPKKSK